MLRIRNWDKHYEKSRTRDVKEMKWLSMHIKLGSDGYATLMHGDNSYSMYGAWCAILQVAAQCEPRGVLIRSNGQDHDAESIAMLTRGDPEVIRCALDRLVGIGWVERGIGESVSKDDVTSSTDPVLKHGNPVQKHLTVQDRTRQNRTEQEITAQKVSSSKTDPPKTKTNSYPEAFERWYAIYPRKAGKFKACEAWKKAIKIVDAETLERQTAEFAKSPMGNTSERKYIKHASVWLNGRHWEDEPSEWGIVYSDAPSEPESPGDWAKTPEEKLARFGLNPKQLAWIEEHGDDFDFPGVKGADHLLPSNRGRSPD